jgi:hypothetical protein
LLRREILCYPNGDSVAGAVALFLKVVNIRPNRTLAVTFSFTIVHPTDPSLNWKNSEFSSQLLFAVLHF